MNELYKKLSLTIDDFNDMNVSRHISQLSGVQYYNTKSLSLYMMIFTVFGLMLSVLFAISCEVVKTKLHAAVGKKNDGKDEEDTSATME